MARPVLGSLLMHRGIGQGPHTLETDEYPAGRRLDGLSGNPAILHRLHKLVTTIARGYSPYVLDKTNNLPVLLGLFGALGGVVAFGFIGIFLGPTLLAVAYSLFRKWTMAEVEERSHLTPPSDSD